MVVASLGNEAIAMCFHAGKYGVPVIAVMPSYVPISYMQRCHAMGAKVIVQGSTLFDAQKYARAIARDRGLTYINGYVFETITYIGSFGYFQNYLSFVLLNLSFLLSSFYCFIAEITQMY